MIEQRLYSGGWERLRTLETKKKQFRYPSNLDLVSLRRAHSGHLMSRGKLSRLAQDRFDRFLMAPKRKREEEIRKVIHEITVTEAADRAAHYYRTQGWKKHGNNLAAVKKAVLRRGGNW